MVRPFEEVYHCDSLTLNLTNTCNLTCTYCFEDNKTPKFMTPQVAIDAIDKAYHKTAPELNSKFMLNFFGGEPLLNWPTIKAVVDHCNEKHYEILYGITTNLTRLSDEMIEYFDDNSFHLLVSVDGLRFVHNKNRSNSWDRVMANLKRLIDAELQMFVEIRMTILPDDIKYALDGVKMFINMGFQNICPIPVTDCNWSDDQIEDLKKYYDDLMRLYVGLLNDESIHKNYSIKNTDEILMNVLEPEVYTPYMCPIGGYRWCDIDTNGDVYPCHQLPTSIPEQRLPQKIGNIYTGVDDTKVTDGKHDAIYPKKHCKDCLGKPVCACGCPEENLRETGDYDTPTDSYCRVQEAMVEAVKRYQQSIISAKNIRNRSLNLLIENLKIKNYVDQTYKHTDIKNRLLVTSRLMHINEMIDSLGEENIFPSFRDYFSDKLIEISAAVLAAKDIDTLYTGTSLKEVTH